MQNDASSIAHSLAWEQVLAGRAHAGVEGVRPELRHMLHLLLGTVSGALVALYLPLLLETPPEGPWWWCFIAECLPPGQPVIPSQPAPAAEPAPGFPLLPWLGGVIGLAWPYLAMGSGIVLLLVRLGTPLRRTRRVEQDGDTVHASLTWEAPGWRQTLTWTLTPELYAVLGQAFGWSQQDGRELSCLYLVAELVADRPLESTPPADTAAQARAAAAAEQQGAWGRLASRWKYRLMLQRAAAGRSGEALTTGAVWHAIERTCPQSSRLMH